MGELNLTPLERALVDAMASPRQGVASRLGFYGSVLVPVLLFVGYGIWVRSVPALVVALLGLLIFVGWRLSRELSGLDIYLSVFRKVAEHERGGEKKT